MKPSDRFVADLSQSRARVERFAAMCRQHGAMMWVYPPALRESEAERMDFADDGDLMLQCRIEHKVRDISFRDAGDFPYPTLIVDEVYKVDRIKARPFRYIIENREGTRIAVIRSATRPHWTVTRRWDKQQGRECDFYEIPKHLAVFCDFGPEALS